MDRLTRPTRDKAQTLDQTAPILPMLPTTPERATHDDVRHGTTTVLIAIVSGSVIVRNYRPTAAASSCVSSRRSTRLP